MKLTDFDFELPPALIAQKPVRPRDAARLLHIMRGDIADRAVGDLPSLLRPGDLLVSNDTKVLKTRLRGRRGGASISVTLHKSIDAQSWLAFARPAKKLRIGDVLDFDADLHAEVFARGEGGEVSLRFDRGGEGLMSALDVVGAMPLPPYIKRPTSDRDDEDDYQTIFAARRGAVAAPTAGLHFTPRLLEALRACGVRLATVTLHVGAGTFLPVTSDDPRAHRMHAEWCELPTATAALIAATRREGGRVVAVGSTSLRTLEAAASHAPELAPWTGESDLFILPGYRFRLVDLLMTNFHLPRSTLFMLVAAFAGLERMRAAYAHAVAQRYRFFSYGDASLIERVES
jgi:S-adenosylmethionine:tRNA ribosyltransferase-isomerase